MKSKTVFTGNFASGITQGAKQSGMSRHFYKKALCKHYEGITMETSTVLLNAKFHSDIKGLYKYPVFEEITLSPIDQTITDLLEECDIPFKENGSLYVLDEIDIIIPKGKVPTLKNAEWMMLAIEIGSKILSKTFGKPKLVKAS